MSQNILTTLPCCGRHGKTQSVDGSGCKNKSDLQSVSKPHIAEALKDIPEEKALSSSDGIMEIFFGLPKKKKKATRFYGDPSQPVGTYH